MDKAYIVVRCTKIKKRNKRIICVFDKELPFNVTKVFYKTSWWTPIQKRTDYKRLSLTYIDECPNFVKPDYYIIQYNPKTPISKEYYWNKLGSLESPEEEEIACYIKIINGLDE